MRLHMKHARAVATVIISFALAACGGGVSGVYSGEQEGFLDQIEFKDDNKVELMFFGMIKEGTYEVEDDRVRVNQGGDIHIFSIDDQGCLDAGGLLGRYCKKGSGSSSNAARSESLVGQEYAAGPFGDQIVLSFMDGSRVRFEVDGEADEGQYQVRGDSIVVKGVEGREMVFERQGRDLVGGADGVQLVFQRR